MCGHETRFVTLKKKKKKNYLETKWQTNDFNLCDFYGSLCFVRFAKWMLRWAGYVATHGMNIIPLEVSRTF